MPNITLTPVISSQLEAIGHDRDTNTLAVRFKGKDDRPGSLYHYQNVTAEKFDEFVAAESKGRFFGANFKNAKEAYPYSRIDETPQEEAAE